jgi:hypothetical protein
VRPMDAIMPVRTSIDVSLTFRVGYTPAKLA